MSTTPTEVQSKILRALKQGKHLKDLVAQTELSEVAVGMEIARLQTAGYLTEDCRLTRKGLRAAG